MEQTCNNFIPKFPRNKNGLNFICSTHNPDGEIVENWGKSWMVLGSHILYEVHEKGCSCSYCQKILDKKTKNRRGIILPKCKARNSWRTIWWRRHSELRYIRWTLPRWFP